jgi:glucose-6-phosphate-specific signal transduction histidine kinase
MENQGKRTLNKNLAEKKQQITELIEDEENIRRQGGEKVDGIHDG